MKIIVSKYMWLCVELLVSLYSIAMIVSLYRNSDFINIGYSGLQSSLITDGVVIDYEVNDGKTASIKVVNTILNLNSTFDWKEHVQVFDFMGNDLMNYVTTKGFVDTSVAGNYHMQFILNWNGSCISKDVVFYVNE